MADDEMRWQRRGPSLAILILLAVATATATTAMCALAQAHSFPSPAVILLLAMLLSQVSLLGIFLGLGTVSGRVRLAILAAGTAVWVANLRIAEVPISRELATLLAVQAIVVALVATALRSFGFYWTTSWRLGRPLADHQLGPGQFTIAQLLGWTTVAAVVAALGRQATFPSGATALIGLALMLAANVVVALSAAWVASAARRFLYRLALLISLAMGLGWITGALFHQIEPGLFGALNVLQALVIAGWIAASRTAGVRIGKCCPIVTQQ
jgi:hypothetical protein